MIKICLKLFLPCFAVINCAHMKSNPIDLDSPETCQPLIGENLIFENQKPVDSLIIEKAYGTTCYTRSGAYLKVKKVSCDKDYAAVSLINVVRPGFFTGPCYKAKALFYNDSTNYEKSETAIIDTKPIKARGLNIQLEVLFGPVLNGDQTETGLVSETGDEASTSKGGIGVSLMYNPTKRLGIGTKFHGMWGSATAPETKSMDFTNQFSIDLFLEGVLMEKPLPFSVFQIVINGGVNYTWLKLADEYVEFVESNEPGIMLFRSTAKGFGYQVIPGLRTYFNRRFFGNLGLGYRYESPKFPEALRPIDGGMLAILMGVGIRI